MVSAHSRWLERIHFVGCLDDDGASLSVDGRNASFSYNGPLSLSQSFRFPSWQGQLPGGRMHALQLTDVTCYVLRFNALSISAIERNT